MKLYWRERDIPALHGLTRQQRKEARHAVLHQAWRHWQVWLPMSVQILGLFAIILTIPHVPLRQLPWLLLLTAILRLASLPFHHHLNYYLNRRSSENPGH